MLEQIWSGWRSSYVVGAGATQSKGLGVNDSSVFTQLLESGLPDEETHIVHRAEHVFSIVNIHPYTSGHVLVLPYREVAEIELLTAEENAELWAVQLAAQSPRISTCTSFRGGLATRTSCQRLPTPRRCLRLSLLLPVASVQPGTRRPPEHLLR